MDDLLQLHRGTVFLRREAMAAGYNDSDLAQGVRAGLLARPRHGGYVAAQVWAASDERQRHLLRCRIVQLTHGDAVMLSHTSAAVAHGLELFEPDLQTIHVTRLDGRTGRIEAGVHHHVPAWTPDQVAQLDGLQVVEPITATLGAALLGTVEQGLVVADSYLSRHPNDAERLHEGYTAIARHPSARRLQLVVRLARPGGTNVFESRCRYAMWRGGLPEPELQWHVYDTNGELIGIADFAWPDHHLLGEADGRIKYGRLLGLNPTPEQISAVMIAEKQREDLLREATGFGMIRYVYGQLRVADEIPRRTRAMLHRYSQLSAG